MNQNINERGHTLSTHAIFRPILTPPPPLHALALIWLTPPAKVCTQGQDPPLEYKVIKLGDFEFAQQE